MTEPYYKRGNVRLYHGDSAEILPTLPRSSAHVIVTDPPYGINYQSNFGHDASPVIANDSVAYSIGSIMQCACKILCNNRHIYLFGQHDLTGLPIGATTELIWDKMRVGLGDLHNTWSACHEYITFTVSELADSRVGQTGALTARLRKGSVLAYDRIAHRPYDHPTQKPVPLLRQLIESSSVDEEVVLDPFMGVGSTCVAAIVEHRGAIGIEIEEKYCEIAARRCDEALDIATQLFSIK